MSPKYKLDKNDVTEMLKVMAWSLGSTIVTVLIAFTENVEVPIEYAFLLPVINTILYSVRLFFAGKVVE